MDTTVRRILLEPLVAGTLSAMVANLEVRRGDFSLTAPAKLTYDRDDRDFVFTLHLATADIPEPLRVGSGGTHGTENEFELRGRIEGEVLFSGRVFPPANLNSHVTQGTSSVRLSTNRLFLTAEALDTQTLDELRAILGTKRPSPSDADVSLTGHLIFHGPRLWITESGTDVVTSNDFLGESSRSSSDTHVFSADGWRAALIQKGRELHLHVETNSAEGSPEEGVLQLIDNVTQAVAFTHGFLPWPVYREVRVEHRVVERWFSAHLGLKQTYAGAINRRLGLQARTSAEDDARSIIPRIAVGWGKHHQEVRDRLETFLWNVRSSISTDLPASTQTLILCAALEGLVDTIVGSSDGTARERWRRACNVLQISWEPWGFAMFERWRDPRNILAHGSFWLAEQAEPASFFNSHPQLVGAFNIMIAAFCGYRGPIVCNAFEMGIKRIDDL